MKTLLTIAGFDPSSGAGISADLAVFAAHGHFGTACITSLTIQNTVGVAAVRSLDPSWIRATLDNLQADLPVSGIKIGMLGAQETVELVADFLAALPLIGTIPVVLDPVLRSSSGRTLLDVGAVAALRSRLLPLVDWITPNIDEMEVLAGVPVPGSKELQTAMLSLQRLGPRLGVIATGGHLDPPTDTLLTSDGEFHHLQGEHIPSTSTHGTGCTFSSSFLSHLVSGDSAVDAAKAAKLYVTEAIRSAPGLGHGHGPLNLNLRHKP